jgi:hypothetical protein
VFDDLPLEEEWKHGLKQLMVVAARIQLETVSLEDTEHVLVHDLGMDEEMVRIIIDDFHSLPCARRWCSTSGMAPRVPSTRRPARRLGTR